MRSILKTIINQLKEQQNKLFLIDSIGAFLTALLLFAVLRNFNQYIGLSKTVLACLAFAAFSLCLYSAACFLFLRQYRGVFLWGIGIANLLYCILTIAVIIVYYPFITVIGLCYFFIEIIIICILVYIELKAASAASRYY